MPLKTAGQNGKSFKTTDEAIQWVKKTLTGDAENEAEQKKILKDIARAKPLMKSSSGVKIVFHPPTGNFAHLEELDEDFDTIGYP